MRGKSVVLVKPQTFMNLSGAAIDPLLKYRNLTSRDLIVVYDELDLPFDRVADQEEWFGGWTQRCQVDYRCAENGSFHTGSGGYTSESSG